MSATGLKQNHGDMGYYIPLGDLTTKIYALAADGTFSAATWASSSAIGSTISTVGAAGILKDMGKTVVSSLRTFRKVQLVIRGAGAAGISTFGTGGGVAQVGAEYYTGYIELGLNGAGTPAPVAHFGR